MKLDAVYLLAPEPDRRVKISRRALLGYLAGAFAAGALGGHSMSVWLRRGATERPHASGDDEAESSVDLDMLAWAREVAAGPIENLFASTAAYVAAVHRYPADGELWRGVERLARHLMETPVRDRFREATSVSNLMSRSPVAEHAALRVELVRRIEAAK